MMLDDDALIAAADLVGRSGSKEFEIGYLHDDVPADQASWWAQATYQGIRIIAENHPGPIEAAEALARRILEGAKCKCGKLVALSDAGAMFYDATMADGSSWTAEEAIKAGQCRWRRYGRRWQQGCEPLPAEYPSVNTTALEQYRTWKARRQEGEQ
jgi:hypothetical protein